MIIYYLIFGFKNILLYSTIDIMNTDTKKRGRKPKNKCIDKSLEIQEKNIVMEIQPEQDNLTVTKKRGRKAKNISIDNPIENQENNIVMEIQPEEEKIEEKQQIVQETRIPKEGDIDYVPDFSFINECYREMIITAYKSVNKLKAWDWFRTFSPSPNEGYMFCSDPVANHIMSVIAQDFSDVIKSSNTLKEQDNHDRPSMSRTMRTLQFIATKGFDKFHEFYFSEL